MINYAGLILIAALITVPFIAVCALVFKSIRDADKIRRLAEQLRFTESKSAGLEHAALMLAEQVRDFGAMKEQQDIIALHLRENCKAQIAAGLHNGRGLGEVVVAYLSGHMPDAAVLPKLGPPEPIPEKLRHLIQPDVSGACCRFHDSGGALGFVTDCPRFQGVDHA